MQYLALIGTVTVIHLLAVISPGPDFIITVRNSLSYSRKTGIYTALGIGLGLSIHIFYSLAGLALVISQSILIFNTIKFLGAGYLVYIGVKTLFSKKSSISIDDKISKEHITKISAIRIGFLTNVLNPKATLFFLSLFTMVISPDTPFHILLLLSAIMIVNTTLWFSLLATIISHKKIRFAFEKYQGPFNKTLGGILVLLGIKVALSAK